MTLVAGDLENPAALQELLGDCTAVIHCAGAVRGNSQADFDRVNVTGTQTILEAAASLGNRPRLLLLSSLAAREPGLSWYAHSKRRAEQLVAEYDLDWLIVRPPAVYGPGDKEMLPVFQAMARGIATVPGTAEARMSLIHVTDLVSALIRCLQAPSTSHQTLSACDGRPGGYDWHELADLVSKTWARKVRIWQVPAWLLDTVARVNLAAAAVTGRAAMLTPQKLCELRHTDWVVDNDAITATTGWTPQISLLEGLEEIRNSAL